MKLGIVSLISIFIYNCVQNRDFHPCCVAKVPFYSRNVYALSKSHLISVVFTQSNYVALVCFCERDVAPNAMEQDEVDAYSY